MSASRVRNISYRLMIAVIMIVVFLDQFSKWWISSRFELGQSYEIVPGFFNFTFVLNPGVAFGMFASLPDPYRLMVLTATTALALAAVIYFVYFEYYHDCIAQACLALIVGGAIGNIIDRCLHGVVIDFIDWHYAGYHWPAFNIADSAICVGVALLIFRKPAEKVAIASDESVSKASSSGAEG